MRAGFVVTEVLNGFRRNITMTIAMILTTAISLGLLGGGLIIARMTDQMRDIYGDKVEVTIYLTPDVRADPDCRESPCQDINRRCRPTRDVETIDFESQAAAFERYKQQFAGQPELLEIGNPDALSASFHVKLNDPQRYRVIAEQFAGKPGVQSVADQSAFLDRLFSLLNGIRNATIIVALVQALAALLLISNMVQVAAYTRRTETGIMRLVGASRWRTQLPFMLEAVIAGLVGAALAIGGLVAAKFLFVDQALGAGDQVRHPAGDRRRDTAGRRRSWPASAPSGRASPRTSRSGCTCGCRRCLGTTVGPARQRPTDRRQQRETGPQDHRVQPQGQARLRDPGHLRGRHRADRHRGQVVAGGPGLAGRRFATVSDDEVWLRGVHIAEYAQGTWTNHAPRRKRKLLLHRPRSSGWTADEGERADPGPAVAVLHRRPGEGRARTGPRQADYDKRQDLAKRDADREIAREMGRRVKGRG